MIKFDLGNEEPEKKESSNSVLEMSLGFSEVKLNLGDLYAEWELGEDYEVLRSIGTGVNGQVMETLHLPS
jgi:hypothetical protein